MGSTAKAVVTGFICRLCSEQKKIVIHLYTERAKKLELLKKIKLLPISVGFVNCSQFSVNVLTIVGG